MAVGAKQNALLGLSPTPGKRSGVSTLADVELLGSWIEVMELQRADPTVIATDDAGAARLIDQDALYSPPMLGHGGGSTFLAAKVAASLEDELGGPMPSTLEDSGLDAAPPQSA
jgi:hypothetical protein